METLLLIFFYLYAGVLFGNAMKAANQFPYTPYLGLVILWPLCLIKQLIEWAGI